MGQTLDAVVLAGGKNSPEMQTATGETNRALVRLGARTMLDYVVTALHESTPIGRIYVVGDVPPDGRYQQIAPGETLMDNLLAGLQAAQAGGETTAALVATSDTPFLTPEAVDHFIQESRASGADLCYPIVPIALCRERFPQMKRTTLRLREGQFTGGNMMLLNPRVILTHQDLILRAYAARKKVLQLGRLLGWGLLLRVLLSQILSPSLLTLGRLESGVSRLLGGLPARAIITPYPEVGTDVDKPDDVEIARELLG